MQTDTDFAQKVVDVIFNNRKLDDSLANMFEEKFREHMKEAVEHEKQSFADSGVFEQEPYQVYDEYEDRVVWTKRYKDNLMVGKKFLEQRLMNCLTQQLKSLYTITCWRNGISLR